MIQFKNVPNERRTRIMRVDGPALVDVFKGKAVQAVDNVLPADAAIVQIGHDHSGTLYLIVSSEEFGALESGQQIPEHPDILFENVDEREARRLMGCE